jgi:hypothetical protein
MNFKRSGNKWTVNEVLSLQREYELLELSIQEIAARHSRSVEAILYKLEAEDLIEHWCNARGFNADNYISFNEEDVNDEDYQDDANDDDLSDDESDDEDEIVNLTHRVNNLEDIVNEVRNMVTNFLVTQNNSIKTSSSSVQYKN